MANAERGLEYLNKAHEKVLSHQKEVENDLKNMQKIVRCYSELSGMHIWRWQLSKTMSNLDAAIKILKESDEFAGQMIAQDSSYPLSEIALNRIKLMLLLRIKENNPRRPDVERYQDKVMRLKTTSRHHSRDTSYLRWYQIITLADSGDGEEAYIRAVRALSEDSKIMNDPGCSDIGRRQYTRLRRFLEQYSSYWHHSSSIGRISQLLQVVHTS